VKEYSPLRFLAFAVGAVLVAIVIFYALSLAIGPHFDAGRAFIERWIVRATCSEFRLEGFVHDDARRPVAYAFVDVAYLGQHMTTRSGPDGSFKVMGKEPICDRQSDTVELYISANTYRPVRRELSFDGKSVDVTLRKGGVERP
jgi:hypothetical protein